MRNKKNSLTKGKNVFIIDIMLIPMFSLVVYSGLKLHIAGHPQDYVHEAWHNWAMIHIISSLVSLIFSYLHIKAHWTWYKKLFKKTKRKKSKITIGLSIILGVELITSIVLILFTDGPNSGVGLWHYRIGLGMIIFLLIHTMNRFKVMMRGLGWQNDKLPNRL